MPTPSLHFLAGHLSFLLFLPTPKRLVFSVAPVHYQRYFSSGNPVFADAAPHLSSLNREEGTSVISPFFFRCFVETSTTINPNLPSPPL